VVGNEIQIHHSRSSETLPLSVFDGMSPKSLSVTTLLIDRPR
jgi:hypothetical protein